MISGVCRVFSFQSILKSCFLKRLSLPKQFLFQKVLWQPWFNIFYFFKFDIGILVWCISVKTFPYVAIAVRHYILAHNPFPRQTVSMYIGSGFLRVIWFSHACINIQPHCLSGLIVWVKVVLTRTVVGDAKLGALATTMATATRTPQNNGFH